MFNVIYVRIDFIIYLIDYCFIYFIVGKSIHAKFSIVLRPCKLLLKVLIVIQQVLKLFFKTYNAYNRGFRNMMKYNLSIYGKNMNL
ncbi:hypothetical protein QTP88_004804 [Uroleucon formosanum]